MMKILQKKNFFIAFMVVMVTIVGIKGFYKKDNDVTEKPKVESSKEVSAIRTKKYRIGYCETSPYPNYAGNLYYIIKGLEDIGLIEGDLDKLPFTWGQNDTSEMWRWISSNNMGKNIEFVQDAYYSLKNDDNKKNEVINRVVEKNDLDLMIVMGTNAGKLLSNGNNKTPIMVFSTSNAVKAGIVGGTEYSMKPNVWAHMDSNRYKNQIEIFYEIFKFKKLGIVFEDSPNGRIFAAVDDINYIAKKRGFEIVPYNISGTKDENDQERYFNDLLQVHKKMAGEVDAVYYTIAPSPGLKVNKLYEVLQPFYEKKIPTFSQLGDEEVEYGALLSVARSDFKEVGLFGAEQILKALNGEALTQIPQMFSDTPAIALNIKVANLIGYKPSFEIMLVADKVYSDIKK